MAIIDKINLGLSKIGKTGAELEKELGLSHSVYSQWNTGKTKPSKKRLPDIANYLGVTVEWLLEETEIPPSKDDGNDPKAELIQLIPGLTDREYQILLSTAKSLVESRPTADND